MNLSSPPVDPRSALPAASSVQFDAQRQPSPSEIRTGQIAQNTNLPFTRPSSPAHCSPRSTSSSDADSEVPPDLFEDSWKARDKCQEQGYKITEAEWQEVRLAGQNEYNSDFEDCAKNFALAKIAMKKLDEQLFRQTVHHMKRTDIDALKETVAAFAKILDKV